MRAALELGDASASLCRGYRWLLAAIGVGALPLLVCAAIGTRAHQFACALLLFPLLVVFLKADRFAHGVALIATAFAAHSVVAILLSRIAPETAAACLPGGSEYWAKNLHWIRTGEDPEYVLANWLPAHAQLTVAMLLFGYVSLGLIPFMQGFYEVDLMNFYVGRLMETSGDAPLSLLLGWHPWSVARGLGYVALIFEVAALSYARLTGTTRRGLRAGRLGLALLFLVADGVIKYGLMEGVRGQLAHAIGG